jgi:hypothetical protein
VGQRLQRQGDAWRSELDGWINLEKREKVKVDRVTLGCNILIKFCDLLHAEMFLSNSESLEIRNGTQQVPSRSGRDCSLLLSTTDKLPKQPGGDVRHWFPPARQLKQPQTEEAIDNTVLPPLKSAALEELLEQMSSEQLRAECRAMGIQGKLNRLQMAESILFKRAAGNSRQAPALTGKVLSFSSWFVV